MAEPVISIRDLTFRYRGRKEPALDGVSLTGKKFAVYIAVAAVASMACAVIIAWWVAVLGLFPFLATLVLIVSNNAIMAIVLGPVLLLALYPRVKQWGLLWTEIMNPEEVSASRLQRVGNVLVWVGSVGGVAAGVILSLTGAASDIGVGLALIPFVALIVVGSFMLGGREQVEAAEEMIAGEGAEA